MSYEYGIVPFDSDYIQWMNEDFGGGNGSLEKALEFINMHTEISQISFTIRKRLIGESGSGELFMVYPFPQLLSQSKLEEQLNKVIEFYKSNDSMTKEEFFEKINYLRTRIYRIQLNSESKN